MNLKNVQEILSNLTTDIILVECTGMMCQMSWYWRPVLKSLRWVCVCVFSYMSIVEDSTPFLYAIYVTGFAIWGLPHTST